MNRYGSSWLVGCKVRYSADSAPVVALDIDGTLGDYHGHFISFAAGWVGRTMPNPEDINPGDPLHRHLGMSKSTYRQCKLAYRQGGLKRSMPCYPGARQLTVEARRAGAQVWICTTRPYLRLDSIDPDTRHWLRRNRIQYDGVLLGEHKYRQLVRQVAVDRIVFVLDDLNEMCAQAVTLGISPVYLRNQPYNTYSLNRYPRVYDLDQAGRIISKELDNWRKSNGKA
jgi:hypothetical protein